MPTALLINDTENWYHFGCTATSLALKKGITTAGYYLTSIPITETYKIQNVPATIEAFAGPLTFERFKKSNVDIVNEIEKRDILIINGEGTIHGISHAALSLLYIAYASKTFMHKHVEILNCSVYPQDNMQLDNQAVTDLYKLVYSNVDFIAVRESNSLNIMQKLGIDVKEAFDCMPLYIEHYIKTRAVIQKNPRKILLTGSAAWLNVNILSNEKGTITKFEKELSGFVLYLNEMNRRGYILEFLYGAKGYPAKDDMEFFSFIAPKLNFKLQLKTVHTLNEWLHAIEEANILISGRFHHTIAAVCLGTSVIALNSNTPKIEGLNNILFPSSTVLHYTDPYIYKNLIDRTDYIIKETKYAQQATLSYLCILARNNFHKLRELRPHHAKEAEESR